MGRKRCAQSEIRKIAYAIYFESKENGLENDPVGDWYKAERIGASWFRYWLWQAKWHLKRYPSSISVVVSSISIVIASLALLANVSVVLTNRTSIDLQNRPYLSIDVLDPARVEQPKDVFYGNRIEISNTGKTAASKVKTAYYITTDLDRANMHGPEWFDRHLGGYGGVSFVPPGGVGAEPGYRSLSPTASYYYFEARVIYEGLSDNVIYWTHLRKVYAVDTQNKSLYPVFSDGEWDRNRHGSAPPISSQETVVQLLESIKTKRLNDATNK